ncbi:Hypothetical protein PHPALM_1556 [Phytophthora palmivora]|uniref:PiggyBac transposable element-derived protein domain-containing protein n=1 Tax=Phytophthora palmivora TaxID=4796 RepID=A0A2P4YS29_9STRA|nr:Hypothetical protein PHPALM_1556 [Phytophthora palmivora]
MVAPASNKTRHTLTPAERKLCLEALRRERQVRREEERNAREKAAAAVPQKKAAAKASVAEAKGSVTEAMPVVAEAKASVEGERAEPAEAKTTSNTKKTPDRKKAPAQTPMMWRMDSVLATTNAQATNVVPAPMATADDAAEVEGAVASMVSMVVEEVTPNKAPTAMTNSRRPSEKPGSSGKRKSVESGDSRKRRRRILQEEKEANDEEIPSDEDNTDVTGVGGGGTAPVSLACVVDGDPNLMSGEAAVCTGLNSDEDSDIREEPEDEEEANDDSWDGDWDIGSLTDEDSDVEMEEPPESVCSSAAKDANETKFVPDPTYADLYDGSFGPTQSVLVVADDPLALLFYFMPPKLWAQIAVESNTYHRQSIPQRARNIRAQQQSKTQHMRRVHGEMKAIPAPELVRDYHRWMGGVGVHDQLRKQRYSVQLAYKTRKYYKTLFLGLFDMALVNAFIVHRYFWKVNNKRPPKHFAFLETLMEQLLAVDSPEAFDTIEIWHADWSDGNDVPRVLLQEHKIRNQPPPSRPGKKRRQTTQVRHQDTGEDGVGAASSEVEDDESGVADSATEADDESQTPPLLDVCNDAEMG